MASCGKMSMDLAPYAEELPPKIRKIPVVVFLSIIGSLIRKNKAAVWPQSQ